MKKVLIALSLILTVNLATAADSLFSRVSVKPYASAIAEDNFNFRHGAAGVELEFNVNKNIGISFDALGIDDLTGPAVDRVGVTLNAKFPLNKYGTSLYGQGGFGYYIEGADTDMILRGGLEHKFGKHFGLFTDIGNGIRLQDGNNYQQVRGGVSISF